MPQAEFVERPILFTAEMVRAILEGRKTQTRRLIDMDRLRADVPRPIVEEINGHHLGATKAGRFRIGLNPQGAVFKIVDGKTTFGLKPGEFDFVCPYAAGRTWITPKTPERSAPWTITPHGSQRLWVRENFWIGHDCDGEDGELWDCFVDLKEDTTAPLQYVASPNNPDKPEEPGDWFGPDDIFPGRTWVPWSGAGLGPSFWSKRPGIHMPRWASRITLEVTEVRVQRVQSITDEDARSEGVEPYTPPHGHISPDQRVPGPGFERCRLGDQPYRLPFADLWDRINGARRRRVPLMVGDPDYTTKRPWKTVIDTSARWEANPWVWAITFRPLSLTRSHATTSLVPDPQHQDVRA